MTKHKMIAAALLIAGAAVFLRPAYADNSEVAVKGRAAIQALDDLNAVTHVVSYVDYMRRVADTKVIVERFVRVAPDNANASDLGKARFLIEIAMADHALALTYWRQALDSQTFKEREETLKLVEEAWEKAKRFTDEARGHVPLPDAT